MENKKYYLEDIENGYSYEVSKERYEEYNKIMNFFKPRVESVKGTMIIFGISGDLENKYFTPNIENSYAT